MAELASQPTTIQSIYTWYKENKLFVNRRYQRKLVWTLEEKQKLIESIIKKYPIPAILIAEREESGTTVHDNFHEAFSHLTSNSSPTAPHISSSHVST